MEILNFYTLGNNNNENITISTGKVGTLGVQGSAILFSGTFKLVSRTVTTPNVFEVDF